MNRLSGYFNKENVVIKGRKSQILAILGPSLLVFILNKLGVLPITNDDILEVTGVKDKVQLVLEEKEIYTDKISSGHQITFTHQIPHIKIDKLLEKEFKTLQEEISILEETEAIEKIISSFIKLDQNKNTKHNDIQQALSDMLAFTHYSELQYNQCIEKKKNKLFISFSTCNTFDFQDIKGFDNLYHMFSSAYFSENRSIIAQVGYVKEIKDLAVKAFYKITKGIPINLSDNMIDIHFNQIGRNLYTELMQNPDVNIKDFFKQNTLGEMKDTSVKKDRFVYTSLFLMLVSYLYLIFIKKLGSSKKQNPL